MHSRGLQVSGREDARFARPCPNLNVRKRNRNAVKGCRRFDGLLKCRKYSNHGNSCSKGHARLQSNLAGTTLDVELKDKVLHVKGDVQNNDQKRAIDEVIKPLIDQAKASGINILNGAIVKG